MERKKVVIGQNPEYIPLEIDYHDEEVIKKNKRLNGKATAKNWVAKDFSWDEDTMKRVFGNTATNMSTLHEGVRHDARVIQMNGMMLDYDDGGMTEDKIVEEQNKLGCASYAFGSISHKTSYEKGERLRLFIPFKEPLTDSVLHKKLEVLILDKYRGDIDGTTLERSRFFYQGNTKKFSSFVDGDFFDWDTYLEENEPQQVPVDKKVMDNLGEKRVFYYKNTDEVVTASGRKCTMGDLDVTTAYKNRISIVCPVCGHNKSRGNPGEPNAVFGYSKEVLKDEKGKARVDENDKTLFRINKDKIVIYCWSCRGREKGSGGFGIYNLHPNDVYIDEINHTGEFAFIGSNTQDYHTIGFYKNSDNLQVKTPKKNTTNMVRNFLTERSITIPKSYPEMELELAFGKRERFSFKEGYVNKYFETDYLKAEMPSGHVAKVPNYIGKVIDHALGHDEVVKERFYNNMGFLLQRREKLITAFLFQGVQGTGKGVVFDIFSEILGSEFTVSADQGDFNKEFNSILENNVFAMVNEVSVDFTGNKTDAVAGRVKIAITEHRPTIEGKGSDRRKGRNVCSINFASNKRHAVTIEEGDRRFNVAPRQEVALVDTKWWPGDYDKMKELYLPEIQEFVWFLKQHDVDVKATTVGLDNEPKRAIQALSRTNQEYFIDAIKNGDLSWFSENAVSHGEFMDSRYTAVQRAKEALQEYTQKNTGKSLVDPRDLLTLYNYIYGKNMSHDQFLGMCRSYGLSTTRTHAAGERARGFLVEWVK